jgi:hypothetical protein
MTVEAPAPVREAELDWIDIGVRSGFQQKYVGFFDSDNDLALRVGSTYNDPQYHSPRHRHTFPQIRFILSGRAQYARETYFPGDCLWIPEGVPYGPLRPVDDADDSTPQLHFVDMQFQGPSGLLYPDPDEVIRARERLSENGSFVDGIYTNSAGKKKDGYEAILSLIMGQDSIDYPEPLTSDYIVLRSPRFPWVNQPGMSGVRVRHLAHFTEAGPNIKLVALVDRAELPSGVASAHQVRFLLKGAFDYGDRSYEALSFSVMPRGTSYSSMRARGETKLLVVQFLSGLKDGDPPVPFDWLVADRVK